MMLCKIEYEDQISKHPSVHFSESSAEVIFGKEDRLDCVEKGQEERRSGSQECL